VHWHNYSKTYTTNYDGIYYTYSPYLTLENTAGFMGLDSSHDGLNPTSFIDQLYDQGVIKSKIFAIS